MLLGGLFCVFLGTTGFPGKIKKMLIKNRGARVTLEKCGNPGRGPRLEYTALWLERNWGHCR